LFGGRNLLAKLKKGVKKNEKEIVDKFGMAQAASVSFNGKLTFVETDTGGVYSGTPFDTDFWGVIDDKNFNPVPLFARPLFRHDSIFLS